MLLLWLLRAYDKPGTVFHAMPHKSSQNSNVISLRNIPQLRNWGNQLPAHLPTSLNGDVCVYWCVVDKQTAAAAACAVSCHYVQRSLGRLTMFAFVQRDSSSFCFLRRRLHLRSIVMAIMQNPRLTQRDERRRGKR